MNTWNSVSNWCLNLKTEPFESARSEIERSQINRLNTSIKSRSLRSITMGLFLVAGIITTGIAIYAPATALSAVTAMNLDIAILSTGIVSALNMPHIRK